MKLIEMFDMIQELDEEAIAVNFSVGELVGIYQEAKKEGIHPLEHMTEIYDEGMAKLEAIKDQVESQRTAEIATMVQKGNHVDSDSAAIVTLDDLDSGLDDDRPHLIESTAT